MKHICLITIDTDMHTYQQKLTTSSIVVRSCKLYQEESLHEAKEDIREA